MFDELKKALAERVSNAELYEHLDGEDAPGRPPLPTRLMAGLHMHDLSDEVLCERWVENPYYQLFCGEEFFCHQLPFDRSSLTRWRQRQLRTCSTPK